MTNTRNARWGGFESWLDAKSGYKNLDEVQPMFVSNNPWVHLGIYDNGGDTEIGAALIARNHGFESCKVFDLSWRRQDGQNIRDFAHTIYNLSVWGAGGRGGTLPSIAIPHDFTPYLLNRLIEAGVRPEQFVTVGSEHIPAAARCVEHLLLDKKILAAGIDVPGYPHLFNALLSLNEDPSSWTSSKQNPSAAPALAMFIAVFAQERAYSRRLDSARQAAE